jgi:hypothetical protein
MHYDMEDLLEQSNEIQESLGRSYAVPDEIDEADLEAGMLISIFVFDEDALKSFQNWMHWGLKRKRRARHTWPISTKSPISSTSHP